MISLPVLLTLQCAVAVILLRSRNLGTYPYCLLATALSSGLVIGAWYTGGVPLFNRLALIALYAALATATAWYAHRVRPLPGWWGGAHERIEPGREAGEAS